MRRRFLRRLLAVVSAAIVILASTVSAAAADPQNGFKTKQPAMLAAGPDAPVGTEIKPIITVGDTIGGYRYEAIPDGISLLQSGKNEAHVFVNHETSTVPFPYPVGALNDFDNAQASRLVIRKGGAILDASMIIPSIAGYHRFCSSFLGTSATGFSRPILFNNEEGIDWVNETGTQWPATEGADNAREIGAVVASDVTAAGTPYKTIWGMGRLNHENSVGVPGYGKPVLLSGDDSFNQVAAQSQVYAYIADNADAVWADTGTLYAFVPDDAYASVNDYFDFAINSATDISGHFIPVPKAIATGKDAAGNDVTSADLFEDDGVTPFPAPPSNGTWQRGPGVTAGPGIDGPQWVLEHWGDMHNVFQFLRIEDIATDKRPGMSNVVYLADSGRGLREDQAFAPQAFRSTNGRIWKMVLDRSNPTIVRSLTVLIEGDDHPVKTVGEIHQPDNLETTAAGSLMVTEDPGSSQQFPVGSTDPAATTARLWWVNLATGGMTVAAKVDQTADEGPTDVDAAAAGNLGAWESSGVVDASEVFGPGAFLVTIQASTLWLEKEIVAPADDPGPLKRGFTKKRSGGQLVLLRVPGA
jgi:hypothetical protein